MLTYAPVTRSLPAIEEYLEKEGKSACDKIANYANKWKQPININKTVGQIFYSQIKQPKVKVVMVGQS